MSRITASMSAESKISLQQCVALESLCVSCPKGQYTEKCPFKLMKGISYTSRMSLLSGMDQSQIEGLFALATDCDCPKEKELRAAL